ncbi:hypothetical protein STRDD11_02701 [Streptococcus sp. DD11]|uniref:hypothetical protein n=1 Tax=Streptococcus sp. DD11 TaxID=1777879 RepID=UPI000793A526|nr:hypothetical protein [Streptococcus sp. DD11]KXT77148.1 hypothetical protein STRDD11_02701 [Streptococcus sp. DD11]
MANYVYQQVICSKDFLEKYFLDFYPIQKEERMDPPYISFNRLMGVVDLEEYYEKYGQYIYYGYGFSYKEQADGRYLVKFATRHDYPIAAIRQAVNLEHTIEWYAIEECCIYISKFYWNDGVKELIQVVGNLSTFVDWVEENYEFDEGLSDEDHIFWYYLQEHGGAWPWLAWSDELNLPRYF